MSDCEKPQDLRTQLDEVSSELKKHLDWAPSYLSPAHDAIRALDELQTASAHAQSALAAQFKEVEGISSRSFGLLEHDSITSDLAETLRRIARASELAQATASASLAETQRALEGLRTLHFEFPVFPKLNLPEFPKIDWDDVKKSQIKGVMRAASCGWTPADWMSIADLRWLGEATDEEIDEFFLSGYLGDKTRAGELGTISKEILQSAAMEKWKSLLEEVFESITDRRYRVCVPALISIIEGFIAESLSKVKGKDLRNLNVSASLKGMGWHEDEDITGIMWMSIVVFVDKLFAHADFELSAPVFINRHWILHGRSATEWTTCDALKLVNALATVHSMFS